ncbi:MAG: GNAT family N-acetyltransferase [Acidobacteriota bacterium]
MTQAPSPIPTRSVVLDDLDVVVRPMTTADRDAVLAFARSLPEDDLLFLQTDITRDDVVDGWVRDVESGRTVTLLAELAARPGERTEQLIAYVSLEHSKSLWTRHLGEILLLVASAGRGRGLGSHLAEQIIEVAKLYDLQKLVVQMTSTLKPAQSLFHRLGFIHEALLDDWVIDRGGRTQDLLVMSREVHAELDDLHDTLDSAPPS